MKTYLILIFSFFAPFHLHAQDKWDLKSCIEYGLAHHRSKNVYFNEQLVAQAKAKEALAGYLPNISVNGSVDDNLKVQESVIPAGLFGPTDTRVAFTKKFGASATIQLDQTIYDQSLLTGLKANKFSKKQADLNVVLNDEAIIYNISTAYYQIFVYKEQLSLLKSNQQTYDQQLAIAKLQLEKGIAMQMDVNKIQVNYNNNASEIAEAEKNLATSENQLKNAMGLALGANLFLEDNAKGLIFQLTDIPDTIFTVENRTEMKLSDVNHALLDIDEKRIKAGIFPKISAYGKYGGNGFGDKLNESISTINDFSAIGIKLSWNLFDGFKRGAQASQARYLRINAIENINLDKQKFQMEYRNSRTQLIKAQQSVFNDKLNIDLAQSVFKSTDLQYRKGVTDLTEWLNAQDDLKDAQNNYLNSLFNFYLARIDLEKANGSLLKFYSSL